VGQQNSGFSDDEISDIVCILYPYSSSARREVSRIARADHQHVVGTEDAVAIEPDYSLEDDASNFQAPQPMGDYAIILRLSASVKNKLQGFQFGRNAAKCDVYFVEDPKKRLSNVHFRVYVNDYGIVMLEDQSTNGTFVDNQLLRAKNPNPHHKLDTRRQLTHGSKIKVLMHDETEDLIFLVRIPRREGEHNLRYMENVDAYRDRVRLAGGGPLDETIVTTPGGHPDLFSTPRAKTGTPTARQVRLAPSAGSHDTTRYQTEWRGSEKYIKVSQIGKGAFAVVHKVTSRYDGKPYAAKELEKRRFVKNGILDQKVENEMKIMQRVTHVGGPLSSIQRRNN
jgi:FHA domain-containing protein